MTQRGRGFIEQGVGGKGKRRAPGRHRVILCAIVAASCVAGIACAQQPAPAPLDLRAPDVRYEPTPMDVVQAMLRLANVNSGDVVYDLGCGDGRIVITAARQFDTRGVCIDIDPRRIAEHMLDSMPLVPFPTYEDMRLKGQ